jgi:hypothetical protein
MPAWSNVMANVVHFLIGLIVLFDQFGRGKHIDSYWIFDQHTRQHYSLMSNVIEIVTYEQTNLYDDQDLVRKQSLIVTWQRLHQPIMISRLVLHRLISCLTCSDSTMWQLLPCLSNSSLPSTLVHGMLVERFVFFDVRQRHDWTCCSFTFVSFPIRFKSWTGSFSLHSTSHDNHVKSNWILVGFGFGSLLFNLQWIFGDLSVVSRWASDAHPNQAPEPIPYGLVKSKR